MRNIWEEDEEAFYSPVTQEMINHAQEFLGVKLPAEYIELIKIKNGGETKYRRYPTTHWNRYAEGWIPFYEIVGIYNDPDDNHSIYITSCMIKEWNLPQNIVLLDGEVHYWVALDYRECGSTGNPSVVWIDVDNKQEFKLANSFSEFINGLVEEWEDHDE